MKKRDFDRLMEFENVGGGMTPFNENADELLQQSIMGQILTFQEVSDRDLTFHNGYFALLAYIYKKLPPTFRAKVPEKFFYKFIVHMKGNFKVIFEFKDGTKLVEYESISFGNMSQKRFENYVREELPYIYENVVGKFYKGKFYTGLVEQIEKEFERFLASLR